MSTAGTGVGAAPPGNRDEVNIGPGALLGGRYELVALLGRGGTADVYRADDRVLQRTVAVKVLRDSADTEADRARFEAEARVLAGLAHPSLVLLLDAGSEGPRPYLVLELVDGETWGERLGGRAGDPREVARLGAQVAAALTAAHAAGVVHRDVKPGNVLVDDAGRARLADFGIARLVDESIRHTRTGFTVGTAAYLAPEQVRGDPVTTAVDVYALGLVLLEAVTGERAYSGTSVETAFARLQRSPTIPVSLPRGWPRLLAAMTATDPAERPTAAAVATRLTALADPVAGGFDVPEDTTAAVPLTPARRRAPRVLVGIAAAFVLLLGVAGVVGSTHGDEEPAAAAAGPARAQRTATPDAGPAAASPVAVAAEATVAAQATSKPGDQRDRGRAGPGKSVKKAVGPGRAKGKAHGKPPGKKHGKSPDRSPGKKHGKSRGQGHAKGRH